jgi:hypothetical protein
VSAQAETVPCYATYRSTFADVEIAGAAHLCGLPSDHDGDHRCAAPSCDATFTDGDDGVACNRCRQGGPAHKPCRDHVKVHCSSEPLLIERRLNRPYDEQTASTLIHSNGTHVASYDRSFLAAATRAIIAAYDEARAAA